MLIWGPCQEKLRKSESSDFGQISGMGARDLYPVVIPGSRRAEIGTVGAQAKQSSQRSVRSDQLATLSRRQLSKCLGNLAQAGRTIRVKSAGARRLLDHPIGRNEHGDRVGGGVILGQPGQRTMRSAA
jgi:hypothetical protein